MDLLQHFFRKRTSGGSEEEAPAEKKPEPSAGPAEHKPEAGSVPSVEQTMAAAAARWRLDRERGIVSRPHSGPAAKPSGHADAEPPPAAEVMLVLDDILPRLPTECLQPGLHDPERELRLSSGDLVAGIARGRATIPLSKLAARYPDVFQAPRSAAADVAVYLPLQKVLRQLSKAGSRPAGYAPAAAIEPTTPPIPRVETTVAPAHRALPPEFAQSLLKPSLHGDLHGLAATTPPAPPAEDLPPMARSIGSAADEPALSSALPAPEGLSKLAGGRSEATPPEPAPETARAPEGPQESPPVPNPAHEPPAANPTTAETPRPPATPAPEGLPKLAGGRSEAPPPEPAPQTARAPEGPQESPPIPSPAHELPAADPAIAGTPRSPATPAAEGLSKLAGDQSEATPPESVPQTARAPEGPQESPPIPSPAHNTVPPPIVVPETLRSTEPLAPTMPAPTVPLPFFATHAPAPSEPSTPFPRVSPPPLRVPSPSAPPAPASVDHELTSPEPATNAAPLTASTVPLRIAAMPASVRPPSINLYAGVHIPPIAEPVEEAEPVSERAHRPPDPDPITETFFTPEPRSYTPPTDEEPEPEPIIATPVPAPLAAPMIEYPIDRIEQAPLQAIFMTEDALDLPRISELSATLPGVSGCLILAGESLAQGGERPAGLNAKTLRDLSDRLTAAAESVSDKLQADRTFTLYGGNRALSLFARQQLCLCVVHGNRGFLPGVRERLTAVADTLARGLEAAEE